MKMRIVEFYTNTILQIRGYIKKKLKNIWNCKNNFVYLYNKLEKYDRTNYTTY